MVTMERLEPWIEAHFARILRRMAPGLEVPAAWGDQSAAFTRLKAEQGRKALAGAVGLEEAEFGAFDAALRDLERTRSQEGETAERNALLAGVRVLSWFETIGQRIPDLALDEELDTLLSEDVGRKQVRALELIVRSLITESYADQAALTARLEQALSKQVVQRWKRSADAGDILSGLTFSELASLFVNKEEFERYEGLYEDTPFLSLLKQKRRTLHAFLDDVRRIRNVLAHNKQVSNLQLTLLDLYYEEIVSPVQTAFDTGETRVDPATYLDVSREEMETWVGGLHDDVLSVKDDLGELRQSLHAALGGIQDDTTAIRKTTQGMNRKVLAIAGGVLLLLVGTVLVMLQGGETQEEVEQTRAGVDRTEAVVRETASDVTALRETTEEAATVMEDATDKVEVATDKVEEATEKFDVATEKVEEATATTTAAAERVEDAATAMTETTERVAQTLEELRDGFVALTKQGGIINDASRPQEHYHNARVYEQRGDMAQAMQSYRAYMAFEDLEFVDPHLRYQALLRLQSGKSGAREVYYDLDKRSDNPVVHFAWSLLLEGEKRAEALDAYIEAHPDFAPAYYERSRDASVARLGTQALEDKRQEKRLLTAFLAKKNDGTFLEHYLDQAVASEQVDDATERLAAVSGTDEGLLANPVTMTAQKSGDDWRVIFIISDPVKEIFYRVGGEGEFKSTGVDATRRTFSGMPQVKWDVVLEKVRGAVRLQVKYTDARDRLLGPYDVPFDPDAQIIANHKNVLESLKGSWVQFGEFMGKGSLMFVGVLGWSAAIEKITYGLNKDIPDREYPFTPATADNPHPRMPDHPWIVFTGPVKYATVQLIYKDGTKSDIVRFDR